MNPPDLRTAFLFIFRVIPIPAETNPRIAVLSFASCGDSRHKAMHQAQGRDMREKMCPSPMLAQNKIFVGKFRDGGQHADSRSDVFRHETNQRVALYQGRASNPSRFIGPVSIAASILPNRKGLDLIACNQRHETQPDVWMARTKFLHDLRKHACDSEICIPDAQLTDLATVSQ